MQAFLIYLCPISRKKFISFEEENACNIKPPIYFLNTGNLKIGTFTNSEDPDERLQNTVFTVCNDKKDLQRKKYYIIWRERSGSVVECLTRDRGAMGYSLTSVTALCP